MNIMNANFRIATKHCIRRCFEITTSLLKLFPIRFESFHCDQTMIIVFSNISMEYDFKILTRYDIIRVYHRTSVFLFFYCTCTVYTGLHTRVLTTSTLTLYTRESATTREEKMERYIPTIR